MKSNSSTELRYSPILTIIQNVNKFSGVGVIMIPGKAPRLCALVNPTTIAVATHYATKEHTIQVGTEVKFWQEPSRAITAVTSTYLTSAKDVTLITLQSPLNDVLAYPLATVEQVKAGKKFVLTGIQSVKVDPRPVFTEVGPTALMSVTSGMAKFRQTAAATMEAGDSGAPDFVYVGDELKLIGPHAAAAPTNWTTSIIDYFI